MQKQEEQKDEKGLGSVEHVQVSLLQKTTGKGVDLMLHLQIGEIWAGDLGHCMPVQQRDLGNKQWREREEEGEVAATTPSTRRQCGSGKQWRHQERGRGEGDATASGIAMISSDDVVSVNSASMMSFHSRLEEETIEIAKERTNSATNYFFDDGKVDVLQSNNESEGEDFSFLNARCGFDVFLTNAGMLERDPLTSLDPNKDHAVNASILVLQSLNYALRALALQL
ncbi:hypothetical protein MRB53_025053 [Persea americana]|uniref:Uncharacterized protein n=1 Tax=Persea americana TaxID=3435 RepID=A0ACC2LEP5_PERAE|nr:hypothetical protein MRB53_025053 [Persea americana]